jgi:predicted ester cyclase
MPVEKNSEALEQAKTQWNLGDLRGYLQLYDPSVVLHGYAGVGPGFEGVQRFYESFWAAFPGSKLSFEDTFGSGDKLVCRFVMRGTHLGQFQNLPATGRPVELAGITILRFANGKCVERWSQADFLGLLVQLGALPTPS